MDTMRWRYGDTNPVVAAVDSAEVIEIGDLLWQDTDTAKVASAQHGQGSETANQEAFANAFLGVAMQRSRSGDTATVRIAATGVFEFDVLKGECFELGDPIGVSCCNHMGPTIPQSQQVTKVSNSRYAIGRVAKREASATTSVLVDIRSTVMTGGVVGSSRQGD